jgi:hypothetical protein
MGVLSVVGTATVPGMCGHPLFLSLKRFLARTRKKTVKRFNRAVAWLRLNWQPTLVIAGIWLAVFGVAFSVRALVVALYPALGWWPSATVTGIAAAAFGLWWTKVNIEDAQ